MKSLLVGIGILLVVAPTASAFGSEKPKQFPLCPQGTHIEEAIGSCVRNIIQAADGSLFCPAGLMVVVTTAESTGGILKDGKWYSCIPVEGKGAKSLKEVNN